MCFIFRFSDLIALCGILCFVELSNLNQLWSSGVKHVSLFAIDAWAMSFAIATIGTSATAVVLYGVRLSDISFAILMLLALFGAAQSVKARGVSSFAKTIWPTLILLIFAVIASTLVVNFFDPVRNVNTLDALAIALSIFTALLITMCDASRLTLVIARLTTAVLAIFSPLALVYLIVGNPDWILLQEDFGRFTGLSQNPNQLALLLLPIPYFICIAYSKGVKSGFVSAVEICSALVLNWLCIGKALFFAWALSFFAIGFLALRNWRDSRKPAALTTYVLVVITAALAAARMLFDLYEGTTRGSIEGQGENRLLLWVNGAKAWLSAPMLGNGPGHYSGVDGPFGGMEAHNLIIDWMAAYGALGGVILLWFYIRVINRTLSSRALLCFGLCLCLVVQGLFHFYGRQPIYWIWWVFAAQMSFSTPKLPLR
jgi:hypothetical protein